METIREKILTNWHLIRWVRLIMGLLIAFQAFQSKDILFGLLSALFIFQAITNTGCCGTAGCSVDSRDKNL
ncbi:hypothetical protein [Daejeonella sp. JGW-45]|uniref:hypothetical protein n=1 Tax=Daejeonella sp. JGW-45 TaxID=3034148 RepID=UPI0023EC81E1|nr:hypothetical protein [Daejeonella sp. JGW-45]